jgi:hypothetical protein
MMSTLAMTVGFASHQRHNSVDPPCQPKHIYLIRYHRFRCPIQLFVMSLWQPDL